MTTIPARVGAPYVIDRAPNGLVRLGRTMSNGHHVYVVFGHKEAIAVADAIVDFVETALTDGRKPRLRYTTRDGLESPSES